MLIIFTFILRKILITHLGIEYQGVLAVFASVIGFLSILELGVGSAITYSMYQPIIQKDYTKLKALFNYYNQTYKKILISIFVIGLSITPFLGVFIKGIVLNFEIYIGYILYLLSIVISYSYASSVSLISAHQKTYKINITNSIVLILQHAIEIIILIYTKNFIIYISIKIFSTILLYFIYKKILNNEYNYILKCENVNLGDTEVADLKKNINAMLYHQIGGSLVFNIDNIVISGISGVIILGFYSNYNTILISIVSIVSLIYSPITAWVGSLFVVKTKQEIEAYYRLIFNTNYIISFSIFTATFLSIDKFLVLWIGSSYILEKTTVIVLVSNTFINFLRQPTLLFRNAAGLFYYDRKKPIYEGITNLILSIILALIIGPVGVIIATIITNLSITYLIEPFVLFKYGFNKSPNKFYFKQYIYAITFILTIIFSTIFKNITFISNEYIDFLIHVIVGMIFGFIVSIFSLIISKEFKNYIQGIMLYILRREKNVK